MNWRRHLARIGALFHRQKVADEIDEEVRIHLEMEEQENRERGMTPEQARYAALRRFGNVTQAQETSREAWGWQWLETLLQDLRYALRQLRRNPGFTAVAVLTLALGIGANTAIFSLMDAVMLRELPVKEPGELVLFGKGSWGGSYGRSDGLPNRSWQLFSFPFYRQVQKKNSVFSGVTAILSLPSKVYGRVGNSEQPERINAQLVSGTYFSVLGVKPVLGRVFTATDDALPGGSPIAVLNYSWWKQRFGKDPAVIGKKLTIRSTVYTIVGVAPPQFFGTEADRVTDLCRRAFKNVEI